MIMIMKVYNKRFQMKTINILIELTFSPDGRVERSDARYDVGLDKDSDDEILDISDDEHGLDGGELDTDHEMLELLVRGVVDDGEPEDAEKGGHQADDV